MNWQETMEEPVRVLQWGMTDGLGGLETFMMNVYRHIDRSKVQFDFLLSHDASPLVFEDEIKELGGRIYRVMYSERESITKARSTLVQFYREHPEYRIVHVNANYPYAYPLKIAKQEGIPCRILHSHNAGSQSDKRKPCVQRLIRYIRDQQVKTQIETYPTDFFACSDMAAHYMFPSKPFTWIRNGIDTNRFAFDSATRYRVRGKFGISDSTIVIGFCGNFREQKNPMKLLEIFREYQLLNSDSKLLLVGDGVLRSRMEQYIEQNGLNDSVIFLGIQKKVEQLYQAMDAFVLPSRFEGLGIVYVEAQCSGLPCLATQDAVPAQAKVSDLIRFVPQEAEPSYWAQILEKQLSQFPVRKDFSTQVRAVGYDIRDVAAWMESWYIAKANGK